LCAQTAPFPQVFPTISQTNTPPIKPLPIIALLQKLRSCWHQEQYFLYLCSKNAKIGCGSAMKGKQVSLCIAVAFHYLCSKRKDAL